MMKFFVVAALFFSFGNMTGNPDIQKIRDFYEDAPFQEKICRKLLKILAPYETGTGQSVLFGYKGAATLIMAKHVFNPFSKLNYFNKGKTMLEDAIAAAPKNVELRLLRFLTQTRTPSFLEYDGHIRTDKNFILKSISQITDPELKKYIVSSLKSSGNLNEKEKNTLQFEQ